MQLAPCQVLVHFIINPLTALTAGLAKMERLYSQGRKQATGRTPQKTHSRDANTLQISTACHALPSPLLLYWGKEGAEKYNLPRDCD